MKLRKHRPTQTGKGRLTPTHFIVATSFDIRSRYLVAYDAAQRMDVATHEVPLLRRERSFFLRGAYASLRCLV